MTQASAYNCAFRSHHLLRFNRGVWGAITGTKSLPRADKSDSNFAFVGSKSLQERSKRPPRGFPRASASKMRLGTDVGPVLDVFLEAPDPQN